MGRREGEKAAADEPQASNRSIGALFIGIHVAPFIEMGIWGRSRPGQVGEARSQRSLWACSFEMQEGRC